mmetsp:Transcript_6856/g.12076  ORF Transcript_6856/g.12076 Transcript_6856/m.12076 type:complete len:348 (-) Transcript_6856:119-1162(-)
MPHCTGVRHRMGTGRIRLLNWIPAYAGDRRPVPSSRIPPHRPDQVQEEWWLEGHELKCVMHDRMRNGHRWICTTSRARPKLVHRNAIDMQRILNKPTSALTTPTNSKATWPILPCSDVGDLNLPLRSESDYQVLYKVERMLVFGLALQLHITHLGAVKRLAQLKSDIVIIDVKIKLRPRREKSGVVNLERVQDFCHAHVETAGSCPLGVEPAAKDLSKRWHPCPACLCTSAGSAPVYRLMYQSYKGRLLQAKQSIVHEPMPLASRKHDQTPHSAATRANSKRPLVGPPRGNLQPTGPVQLHSCGKCGCARRKGCGKREGWNNQPQALHPVGSVWSAIHHRTSRVLST